jgi:hypothetical protein
MSVSLESIEAQVRQLTRAERVRLLDRVVASLDVDPLTEAAWDRVAAERNAAAESDPSLLLPLDDVIRSLNDELR